MIVEEIKLTQSHSPPLQNKDVPHIPDSDDEQAKEHLNRRKFTPANERKTSQKIGTSRLGQ